jgi:hypothetical protein
MAAALTEPAEAARGAVAGNVFQAVGLAGCGCVGSRSRRVIPEFDRTSRFVSASQRSLGAGEEMVKLFFLHGSHAASLAKKKYKRNEKKNAAGHLSIFFIFIIV